DGLAARASRKLKSDELLIASLAGTRLRMELDRVPLWRGEGKRDVAIKQLIDDFARYPYLPRLTDPSVLLGAVRDGLGLMLWRQDSSAYADSYDESSKRYLGLRAGDTSIPLGDGNSGLLVRPDVAVEQMERDRAGAEGEVTGGAGGAGTGARG